MRPPTENKTPTQMFACEICEIFKNTYFEQHVPLLLTKGCEKLTLCWVRKANPI